jgi:hypothetical protein
MVKAETSSFRGFHSLPILTGGFQQGKGASDIGSYEICRAIYRAIYVAFGGQVHDGVWLVLGQYAVYFGAVADIYLLEDVAFAVAHFYEAFKVASVGKFIKIDHFIAGIFDYVTNYGGSYEAGAACD